MKITSYNPFARLFETKSSPHAFTLRSTYLEKVSAVGAILGGVYTENGQGIGMGDTYEAGLLDYIPLFGLKLLAAKLTPTDSKPGLVFGLSGLAQGIVSICLVPLSLSVAAAVHGVSTWLTRESTQILSDKGNDPIVGTYTKNELSTLNDLSPAAQQTVVEGFLSRLKATLLLNVRSKWNFRLGKDHTEVLEDGSTLVDNQGHEGKTVLMQKGITAAMESISTEMAASVHAVMTEKLDPAACAPVLAAHFSKNACVDDVRLTAETFKPRDLLVEAAELITGLASTIKPKKTM